MNTARPITRRWTRSLSSATISLMLLSPLALGVPGAGADTVPTDARLPVTVTNDLLPSPQINGVAWRVKLAGDKVFVGGQFTSARPFGVAPGFNEIPRSNFLAFDANTGALLPAFSQGMNGPVKAMATSADGRVLYVGGNFTKVGNTPRYRLAAFDTATGALLPWAPRTDFRVEAIDVKGNAVYFGGKFSSVNGQARRNLGAVHAQTGAVLPWSPSVDLPVMGLAVSPDGSKVVVGGQFLTINGQPSRGWGAISTATGAKLPWIGHPKIYNSTVHAGIYSVKGTADGVYICGYSFDTRNPYPFEGTAKAKWSTGEVEFVNPTRGDSYDIAVGHNVLYAVNHMHDGGMMGVFPETPKWQYQRAQASTTTPSPFGRRASRGDFRNTVTGELLHWYPEMDAGRVTGTNQAAWALDANDKYLIMAGEFPRINGVRQQGIARFGVPAVAPKKSGPRPAWEMTLTPTQEAANRVRFNFRGLYDRDNAKLSYELMRGDVVVARTETMNVSWWNRPNLELRDTNAPRGMHTYRVRVTDPNGNRVLSPLAQITVR